MKRLFVSDLDGTLLNSKGEISDITVELLNQGIANGLEFTISTARTPATALQLVEKLHLNLPVMLMNGALIYDMQKQCYLKQAVMEEQVVMVLLGLIKVKGLSCFLYAVDENRFVAYYDSVESKSLNYFRNERIMKFDKKFVEVEDLSLVARNHIVYCVLREPKEKLEGLYRELSVVKGVKAEFYQDVYNEEYYMLEIYSDVASKKEALEYLKVNRHYDSIVGFGDNLNDIPFMEACDYFYAVSNAHPQIQNMADAVIPSNDEDGVARFIETMVRETTDETIVL